MKNLSTIIFNLLISLTITSCGTLQYNVSENYITEVINNYSTEMPEKHTESGELSNDVFWDFIRDNNIALNSYLNNRSKLRKNATNDFRVMSNKANKFLYKTNEIELSNKIGNEIVGVNYKKHFNQIIFESMGEPYAYVVPNGDIYVSYEIVELLSDCGKGIDGIIAHELTHLVLRHSEVNYYVNRRIAKKNKTKSSVMAGLAGLATGALMIGAIEIGVRVDDVTPYTQLAANSALAIDEAYTVNTKRKQYLYSREQEIEADIVAVLYLKWNSYNPEDYVKALDRLPESFYISEYDTHPANEFRINFLKSFIRVGELQLKNEKEILNYNDDIYR